jgi:transposase
VVARYLDINEGTLGKVGEPGPAGPGGHHGPVHGGVAKWKRLGAENAELRIERDVLKRSVVLSVKEATK